MSIRDFGWRMLVVILVPIDMVIPARSRARLRRQCRVSLVGINPFRLLAAFELGVCEMLH